MTSEQVAKRWERLIQAGERNARVCKWWDDFRDGYRTARIKRMYAINHAAGRTDMVFWDKNGEKY